MFPLSLLLFALIAPSKAAPAEIESNSIVGVYTVSQDTGDDIPLASKLFPWPYFPEQADTGDGSDNGDRGPQSGYNICNSSTAGPDSLCQTAYINNVSDFCLWGATTPNSIVGDIEGEMVAYCTSDRWGTRVIPSGAITGLQFIRTPHYVEVVGFIDQTKLNLQASDPGGEEDDHGQDNRGNPIGSLVYSNAFNATNPGTKYQQVTEWALFLDSGIFCAKACDPAYDDGATMCNHVYDEVGCEYNDPANYDAINGTFQYCLGDDQLPPGVYVENGVTYTWYQTAPYDPPYTPAIPQTSSCTFYTSASLFASVTSSTTTTTTTTTTTSKASSTLAKTGQVSVTTATSSASSTASGSSGSTSGATGGMGGKELAVAVGVSLLALVGGVIV